MKNIFTGLNKKALFLIMSELTCSICIGDLKVTRHTPKLDCGHQFHQHCLTKWKSTRSTCPMCRQILELPKEHFRATLIIEDVRLGVIESRHTLSQQTLVRVLNNFGLTEDDVSNLVTEFTFDVETREHLGELMNDFGVEVNSGELSGQTAAVSQSH